jgi:SAM-dependent methyltransferase
MLDLISEAAKSLQPDSQELRPWYAAYSESHSVRLAFDLAMAENYANAGERILEYGSVPPVLTAALTKLKFKVKGLDIAPERFSKAIEKLGLEIMKCNVEDDLIHFKDDYFDIIIFNELSEHLRINPIFTLRETLRVLKPGGKLLLSTPNLRSVYGIRNF